MIPDLKTLALVAFIFGLIGTGIGYRVADWRISGIYAAEKLAASEEARAKLASLTAERDAKASALAKANDQHSLDLRKAQNETTKLRDRLLNNDLRLRIAAMCPDSTAQATDGARVDNGAGAELAPTARRAYFSLRDGIDRASAQLAACQSELALRSQ